MLDLIQSVLHGGTKKTKITKAALICSNNKAMCSLIVLWKQFFFWIF